jgi:hypothetical protein
MVRREWHQLYSRMSVPSVPSNKRLVRRTTWWFARTIGTSNCEMDRSDSPSCRRTWKVTRSNDFKTSSLDAASAFACETGLPVAQSSASSVIK